MSKAKKTVRQIREEQSAFNKFNLSSVIPEKYHTPVYLGIILVLFLIFFAPMYFGDKTFHSADIVTSKSMTNYVAKHEGDYTLWNPYIFCGLPAHALSVGFKWFNLVYVAVTGVKTAFTSFFAVKYTAWTFYLILLAFTTYFFVKYLTENKLISMLAGFATSFSTGIIVFLYIGHVTKLTALCMYPLIFLILFKFQKKIKLLDAAILIIALQLLVQGWHVQIIFYTLLAVGIYFLYFLLRSFLKKEKQFTIQMLKSAGLFVVAAIIALAIQADNFTQIYNYTPYSTRGTKQLAEETDVAKAQSEAAFYEYATDWSFSPGEVMTMIIPSFYGFGNSIYKGPLTGGQEFQVNTYFGQMRFVDVAVGYMGVLIFFLALFGIFTQWKNPFVQFITILVVFALLISFGRTFSPVFNFMFYYFPFFDKFRVPSMMLVLVQLSMPVLAAFGVQKILTLRTEKDSRAENLIRYAAYLFSGLFVISLILSGVLRDWIIDRAKDSGKYSQQLQVLSEYLSDMFVADALIAFAFSAIIFWLAFAYLKNKLSIDLFIIVIIILTVFDLWRIDNRGAEYIQAQNEEALFVEPGYVSIIKKQNDTSPFRLFNVKQDRTLGSLSQPSNYHAYFLLQDIYGYSGIKPRAVQDIMDAHGGAPIGETLWRMLNVKYLITEKPVISPSLAFVDSAQGSVVYKNLNALPRAYFVNRVEQKPSTEILTAMKNNSFDPKEVAYLEEGSIKVDVPDSTAKVNIKSYKDERITIEVKASGNNFMFLGDTYFPGTELLSFPLGGWKAYVDGNETEIYRANHGFRGIVVPGGNHTVEFIYAPISFTISKYLALILSSLVFIGLFVGIFMEYKKIKTRTV